MSAVRFSQHGRPPVLELDADDDDDSPHAAQQHELEQQLRGPLRISVSVATPLLTRQDDPWFSFLSVKTPVSVRTLDNSELHEASALGDVVKARRCLELSAKQGTLPVAVNRRNANGFSPLMNAAALASEHASAEMLTLLLDAGADVNAADGEGLTALHWAASVGEARRVALLLGRGADANSRSRAAGETPLHRACRFGRVSAVAALLRGGASLALRNRASLAPIDVAGRYEGAPNKEYRDAALRVLTAHDPRQRTAVYWHPDCLAHVTKAGHQEAPERVTAILDRVRDSARFSEAEIQLRCSDAAVPLATEAQVLRAHSEQYWNLVRALAKHVERRGDPSFGVPFTPMVQRGLRRAPEGQQKASEHSDTTFSTGSFPAALRAAGAVCAAVDAVIAGDARNALCVVRPPGHHAGVNGLMTDFASSQSCGFCIFNSVAIGALHALEVGGGPSRPPSSASAAAAPQPSRAASSSSSSSSSRAEVPKPPIRRVAIIDIDVHHGNGTEEIVRRWAEAHRDDPEKGLFFFSCHLFDIERRRDGGGAGADASGVGEEAAADGAQRDRSQSTAAGGGGEDLSGGAAAAARPATKASPAKMKTRRSARGSAAPAAAAASSVAAPATATGADAEGERGESTPAAAEGGWSQATDAGPSQGAGAPGSHHKQQPPLPRTKGAGAGRQRNAARGGAKPPPEGSGGHAEHAGSGASAPPQLPRRGGDAAADEPPQKRIRFRIGAGTAGGDPSPVPLDDALIDAALPSSAMTQQAPTIALGTVFFPHQQKQARRAEPSAASASAAAAGSGSSDIAPNNAAPLLSPAVPATASAVTPFVVRSAVITELGSGPAHPQQNHYVRMLDLPRTGSVTASKSSANHASPGTDAPFAAGSASSQASLPAVAASGLGTPSTSAAAVQRRNKRKRDDATSHTSQAGVAPAGAPSLSCDAAGSGARVVEAAGPDGAVVRVRRSFSDAGSAAAAAARRPSMGGAASLFMTEPGPSAAHPASGPKVGALRHSESSGATPRGGGGGGGFPGVGAPGTKGSGIVGDMNLLLQHVTTGGISLTPRQEVLLPLRSPAMEAASARGGSFAPGASAVPASTSYRRASAAAGKPGELLRSPDNDSTATSLHQSGGAMQLPLLGRQDSIGGFSFAASGGSVGSVQSAVSPPPQQAAGRGVAGVSVAHGAAAVGTLLGPHSAPSDGSASPGYKPSRPFSVNSVASAVAAGRMSTAAAAVGGLADANDTLGLAVLTPAAAAAAASVAAEPCCGSETRWKPKASYASSAAAAPLPFPPLLASETRVDEVVDGVGTRVIILGGGAAAPLHASPGAAQQQQQSTEPQPPPHHVLPRPGVSVPGSGWLGGGAAQAADSLDDADIVYSFYPSTGGEDYLDANVINAPIAPLWRLRPEHKSKQRVPLRATFGRLAVRRAIAQRLLPSLRAFCPDLILMSSGFDGAAGDVGNTKADGRASPGLNLTPEDFRWITAQVLSVARVCCPGRCVSVLEGGYGRWTFQRVPVSGSAAGAAAQRGAAVAAGEEPSNGDGSGGADAALAGGRPMSTTSGVEAGSTASETPTSGGFALPIAAPPRSVAATTAASSLGSSASNSSSSSSAQAAGTDTQPGFINAPVLLRDNLGECCAEHLRALVDDGASLDVEPLSSNGFDA